ncbi:MAG: hypothetical protein D3919_08625 [Candidatus Electrothrix sp. AW5]|nr:hypothetical protein [Candidatus Electrothrix gigas]
MIKALPTLYRGIKYRSRLEATWAYFFDRIGFKYHYEMEGFKINDLCYLPDFFLPEQDTWIEIKPKRPTKQERLKIASLLIELIKSGSESNVGILYGRPWIDEQAPEYIYLNFYPLLGTLEVDGKIYHITAENITLEHIEDNEQIFVQCQRCNQIGLDSVAIHYPDQFGGYHGFSGCCDNPGTTTPYGDRLLAAYKKATNKKWWS